MKKITFNGKERTLKEWSEKLGVSYHTLYQRIYVKGMDLEQALGKHKRKTIRAVVIGDIHVPYQLDNLMDKIADVEDLDYIVIGGDLVDCESCTSFPILERPSLEQELMKAHEFIKELIKRTGAKIKCIKGNHEERLEKEIMKMHTKGIQRMLDTQLLRMLQDGFNFYENGRKVKYEPIEGFEYIDKWYAKLFDNLVVCHPKNFSNVPGKVAEQSAEHFLNKGIIDKDDVVFVQHTHKFSNIIASRRQDIFVIENGCACKPMEYADRGNLSYGSQVNCFTLIEFVEGEKIDKNNIRTIFL